jgi:uncharacterized membrane protein
LFFPNAPYIFTDVIHLLHGHREYFWVELSLVLLCALTGLVLGFVSLYLMQALVAARMGAGWSWVFVAGVAAVSSFGIYLGRFLRFNSWDVLLRPGQLAEQVGGLLADPLAQPLSVAFAGLYAVFIFLAYVMLHALTRLPRPAIGQGMDSVRGCD